MPTRQLFKLRVFYAVALFALYLPTTLAERVRFDEKLVGNKQTFYLGNDKITCSVIFIDRKLGSDRLETKSEWSSKFGVGKTIIETDADFILDVMWTGWRAPGKISNADNPVQFSKKDFQLKRQEIRELEGGVKELNLYFFGLNNPFKLRMTYQLKPEAFYLRRKIAISDTLGGLHFLRKIWPRRGEIYGEASIVKEGGFGQPVAFKIGEGGGFFGLEYPTSKNHLTLDNGKIMILCGQVMGGKIGNKWVNSEWVVSAITPDHYLKRWFFSYIDDIRVAPLKPYTLYNTWYDLRDPVMVKDSLNVMNEKNVKRIINLFRKNMIEKHNLNLDAFVLDDGWDVYKSDWVLSSEQFPNGLKPIAIDLKKTNTNLGIWIGPIGGYSHRNWRLGWMREHGYEVVGGELCLAGKKYSQLFKKRVVDFVEKYGVGYFKWDGIQFSCSEPDHGHPIGIYSRRAVMESVIEKCRAVREKKPDIFLNITSGTWLSPWWVKYANTIWMQGGDYGYSEVPSISRRDAAMTYRDYVLYDDFRKKDFWFPIANLMTHGIIKGNLQGLREKEPLDKFTNNALLYFARGVSMWELYISPDLLTEGEWNAISNSIKWAKDRFSILSKPTEIIGENPGDGMAYGYTHFSGKHGILAARNPFIEPKSLIIELTPYYGVVPDAKSLVLERVYPTQWISPKLYSSGAKIEIQLDGYETAIYEIYPLKEASKPLLAGVTFDPVNIKGNKLNLKFYNANEARILNPEKVKTIEYCGKKVGLKNLSISIEHQSTPVEDYSVKRVNQKEGSEIDVRFTLRESSHQATLSILLSPSEGSKGKALPKVTIYLDRKEAKASIQIQKGLWEWYSINVSPGKHLSKIHIIPTQNKEWKGKASVWLISKQEQIVKEISFTSKEKLIKRPLPPRVLPSGVIQRTIKLGEVEI